MKRLKQKYAERTRDVLYELWHFSHNMHERYNQRSTSKVPKLNPDNFKRDELLELIKEIDKYTDRLYLIRKSWSDDLDALAEILTRKEGEQYLEQVDLPESLLRIVLGE